MGIGMMEHLLQELSGALGSGVLAHRGPVALGGGMTVEPARMARIILGDYERVRRAPPGGWLAADEVHTLHDDLLRLLLLVRTPPHRTDHRGVSPQDPAVAALVHDSQRHHPIMGIRSIRTPKRRLLFEVDGISVDLEVNGSKTDGRLRLLGQIMAGEPHQDPAWVLIAGASGCLESETDDLGQFSLDGLLAGAHHIAVGLTHDVIDIPTLQL